MFRGGEPPTLVKNNSHKFTNLLHTALPVLSSNYVNYLLQSWAIPWMSTSSLRHSLWQRHCTSNYFLLSRALPGCIYIYISIYNISYLSVYNSTHIYLSIYISSHIDQYMYHVFYISIYIISYRSVYIIYVSITQHIYVSIYHIMADISVYIPIIYI